MSAVVSALGWRKKLGLIYKDKQPVFLSSLLKEAGDQIEGLSVICQVAIHWGSFEDVSICADRNLLVRALVNVISNAIDHAPHCGNVYVDSIGSDDLISFVVTDEGKGFSPQALTHATERFFMDDSSRSSKSHYGIGLYMTASIVQKHGGKLILENVTGNGGARVTIQIPR